MLDMTRQESQKDTTLRLSPRSKTALFIASLCLLLLCMQPFEVEAQWKPSTLNSQRVKQTIRPRKIALLIGIHHFKNPHWETLKYTRTDTQNMAKVLKRTAKFDRILIRNTFKETTKEALIQAFKDIKRLVKSKQDTILVYISGHGSVAYSLDRKQHRRFIITSNTTKNVSKTALSVNQILSYLKEYGSRKMLLFLATCYTGAPMSKSRNAPGTKGGTRPLMPLRSRAVQILSASGYAQPAFESNILKGDVYTHYFVRCLQSLHKKKRHVSAIEAHICAARPTTLFVKKHRNEIQVPQVDSQPGANQDITLTNEPLRSKKRGYLVTPSLKTRLLRYFIKKFRGGRKGQALIATNSEEVALPPGRYVITQKDDQGRTIKRQTIDIQPGHTTYWHPTAPKRPSPKDLHKDLPKTPQKTRSITPFGVDIFPFFGTSGYNKAQSIRIASLNILAGHAAGLMGLEIGTLLNLQHGAVYGVQIAGLVNIDRAALRGVQVAGLVNIDKKALHGVQIAGLGSIVSEHAYGLQIAGLFNIVQGAFRGFQLGSIFNKTSSLTGSQMSLVNINTGYLRGLQAGLINITTEGFSGVQMGLANVNTGSQWGPQLGLFNLQTTKQRALQFGLINVSRRSNLSLGLVNVILDGRTHVDIHVSETRFVQVSLKHGDDHFHHIVGLGGRTLAQNSWLVTLGFGGHIPLMQGLFIDIDLLAQHINNDEAWTNQLNMITTLRAVIGWRVNKWFKMIGGVSYNMLLTTKTNIADYALFGETEFLKRGIDQDITIRGWPGIIIGMQFL
ncbi:MAG: hypothetical protein CL920_26935 [Deltaproteobacteria bacterium]|nr:hypothetical protein [Deltaproteobacteria bacterium]|tara:strand:+ start:12889 stop:15249 length:2361 start_codon:yes stop_codon:yes gene_type:complete